MENENIDKTFLFLFFLEKDRNKCFRKFSYIRMERVLLCDVRLLLRNKGCGVFGTRRGGKRKRFRFCPKSKWGEMGKVFMWNRPP